MNKKIAAFSLAAVTAFTAIGITALADEPIKVLVNGTAVTFEDTEPFIENGHTLVPMRAIFEALGASVNWDGDTKTVVSYDPVSDVSITMQIDNDTMFVGEEKVELETPARLVNDRTVVPVRAIAEGMNSVVGWDDATRTVTVEKELTPAKKDDEKAEDQTAGIANPWQDFKTLDELNAAINENGDVKYSVSDLSIPAEVKENGYRYLASENLAEIQAVWAVGSGADVVVRTAPTDSDISGISGGEKVEEYTEGDNLVEIYKYENTVYASWACKDAGSVFSHSVAVTAEDFDPTEVVKTLVKDIEENHPKG